MSRVSETTASTLPICTCDHDFWNGMNFHLPSCSKGPAVAAVAQVFRVIYEVQGSVWTRRIDLAPPLFEVPL